MLAHEMEARFFVPFPPSYTISILHLMQRLRAHTDMFSTGISEWKNTGMIQRKFEVCPRSVD